MADAPDVGSGVFGRGGSSPPSRTLVTPAGVGTTPAGSIPAFADVKDLEPGRASRCRRLRIAGNQVAPVQHGRSDRVRDVERYTVGRSDPRHRTAGRGIVASDLDVAIR